MYTLSEENYLKAIYRLAQDDKQKVSTKAISDALGNNPASVVDMIRKLVEKELIAYDKKIGVKLTSQGKKNAVQVVRKHRLWEVFLLEKLGYQWHEIHSIAEELEHIKDATLADRLEQFLGFPKFDPHGDPIPNAYGKVPKSSTVNLSQLKEGANCRVAAVQDSSAAFLQYLLKLGIGIGTHICLLEKIAFDDSLVISIEKHEKASVSQKFGENILVDELQ